MEDWKELCICTICGPRNWCSETDRRLCARRRAHNLKTPALDCTALKFQFVAASTPDTAVTRGIGRVVEHGAPRNGLRAAFVQRWTTKSPVFGSNRDCLSDWSRLLANVDFEVRIRRNRLRAAFFRAEVISGARAVFTLDTGFRSVKVSGWRCLDNRGGAIQEHDDDRSCCSPQGGMRTSFHTSREYSFPDPG